MKTSSDTSANSSINFIHLDTSLPDEPYMTDGDGEQNLRGGENE